MQEKYLITIVGPTAIGKTALSIQLAQYFNCPIISCDSRQFYKEMNIGTAVPSATELAQATHYFIQSQSIFDKYTVGDFEKDALVKLEELYTSNNVVILVGGSGLYVDALLYGLDHFPEISESIREQISFEYEQNGIDFLQRKLHELDPIYFDKLTKENPQTLMNPQRLMRFVEVCLGSGQPYSTFLNKKQNDRIFTPILIGLEAERAIIYNRINQRVDLMFEQGLEEEAKRLLPYQTLNALHTVGYKELFDYFEKKTSLETAVEEIKKNTRRFAKRQLTWFKKNKMTHWFDYDTNFEAITTLIQSKF